MKKIIQFNMLILLYIICVISGCASTGFLMAKPKVTMLGEAGIPKSPMANIDIYYTNTPDNKYEEIAIIKVGDTDDDWNLKQIKIKAREIGADGAIIIGRPGSYVYVTNMGTSTDSFSTSSGIGAGEGYDIEAVAIRYK